jgi:hypothetical protein
VKHSNPDELAYWSVLEQLWAGLPKGTILLLGATTWLLLGGGLWGIGAMVSVVA